jgi:hypothetical protein
MTEGGRYQRDARIQREHRWVSGPRMVKEIMRLGRSTSANHAGAVCRELACQEELCQPEQGRAVGYACPDGFAPCDNARDIRLELF